MTIFFFFFVRWDAVFRTPNLGKVDTQPLNYWPMALTKLFNSSENVEEQKDNGFAGPFDKEWTKYLKSSSDRTIGMLLTVGQIY